MGQHIERLFQDHRQALIRWVHRIVRCEATAADLAQESYLRMMGGPSDQSFNSPKAFLFRTATNLALDHVRREKFRGQAAESLDAASEVPTSFPSAEQVLLDKERLDLFVNALRNLPPRCREVFLLHRLDECPYSEIAMRLGISESAVEKHIMRALSYCRQALHTKE